MTSSAAAALLSRQLREMQRSKDLPGISCGLVSDSNVFEWEVMLMISDDCKYYGGASFPLSYTSNLSCSMHIPAAPATTMTKTREG